MNDLKLALELADIADAISLDRYLSLDLVVETKPDRTPVTDADQGVEQAIRTRLLEQRPSDGLVGEEFGDHNKEASRYWVVDPIDGTANFLRGVPTWATLIALIERSADGTENVIVGVASAPALYRRWYASKGQGAFVVENGSAPRRIKVSKVSKVSDASSAYSDFRGWGDRLDSWRTILDNSWRTRGYGDFWSHVLVAEGSVDIAAEPSLKLWDMAALDVIVTEAGGTFTDLDGNHGPFGAGALSTNGALLSEVLEGLKK